MNLALQSSHILIALGFGLGGGLLVALLSWLVGLADQSHKRAIAFVASLAVGVGSALAWFALDPIKSDHAFQWRFWSPSHPLGLVIMLAGPAGLMAAFFGGFVAGGNLSNKLKVSALAPLFCALGFFGAWSAAHEWTPAGTYSWVNVDCYHSDKWWDTPSEKEYMNFIIDWCGPHLSQEYPWRIEKPVADYLIISKDYSDGAKRVYNGPSIRLDAPFTYAQIKEAVWKVASSREKPIPVAPEKP